MSRNKLIATRVADDTKIAFNQLAMAQGMTESAMLNAMIDTVLGRNRCPVTPAVDTAPSRDRMTIRLRPGDRQLLDARALARRMPSSSYCVMLLRAHLRQGAPLPTEELQALKASLGHLSAVGRNLNQIAHRLQTHHDGVSTAAIPMLLNETQRCIASLRSELGALIRRNLQSWEIHDA